MCEVCHYLLGTCKAEYHAAEAFNMEPEEVLDRIVECGEIECCEGCNWWFEVCELDEDNLCADCR